MSTKDIQFNLRIPQELKDKVVEASVTSGRSINAEAAFRLEQSFQSNACAEPQPIKIFVFENMPGVGISIELNGAVVGLMKNQLSELNVSKNPDDTWMLSYRALRCMIDEKNAKKLIDLGCNS